MSVNLFAIARSNIPTLEAEYTTALDIGASPNPVLIRELAERVQTDARVSMNFRQMDLLLFLNSGVYENMWHWAADVEKRSGKPQLESVRERLGIYSEKRLSFDDYFVDGRSFAYAAVNIGGMGSIQYGNHCVVLQNRLFEDIEEVAYLKKDSLKHYVSDTLVVDEVGITRDSAPNSHRHLLCAVKHKTDVAAIRSDQWPKMLCSSSSYVECIFSKTIRPEDMQEVRMSQFDYDLYFYFAFKNFSESLSEFDKYQVKAFVLMLEKLEALGIPLRSIPDA